MEKLFKGLSKFLEFALVFIFVILVVDVLWQVIARYGKINSDFTEELSRFLLIWLSVLATAYSRSYKGQMAIDFVYEKFSERNKYRISLFIEVCIIAFSLSIMIVGGINLVYITLKLGQLSPSLNLPIGLVYSVVPFSGVLILFFSVYHMNSYIKNRAIFLSTNLN